MTSNRQGYSEHLRMLRRLSNKLVMVPSLIGAGPLADAIRLWRHASAEPHRQLLVDSLHLLPASLCGRKANILLRECGLWHTLALIGC